MALSRFHTPRLERRGDIAWYKAVTAKLEYVKTVDEIEDRFSLMLDLRDRAIKRLEEQMVRLKTRIEDADQRLNFRVLVIEESPILRAVLVAALQRKFCAFGAADVTAALECPFEEPNAILIDVHSCEDRVEPILKEISRAARGRLPLMVICDSESKDLLENFEGLGLYAVFPRPFRIKEIIAKVGALCADTKSGGASPDSPDSPIGPRDMKRTPGFAGDSALPNHQPYPWPALGADLGGTKAERP